MNRICHRSICWMTCFKGPERDTRKDSYCAIWLDLEGHWVDHEHHVPDGDFHVALVVDDGWEVVLVDEVLGQEIAALSREVIEQLVERHVVLGSNDEGISYKVFERKGYNMREIPQMSRLLPSSSSSSSSSSSLSSSLRQMHCVLPTFGYQYSCEIYKEKVHNMQRGCYPSVLKRG